MTATPNLVGGVNVTPPVPPKGEQGTKDTLQAAREAVGETSTQLEQPSDPAPAALVSCAPDGSSLIPLEQPGECGHITDNRIPRRCIRGPHPDHPNGHVYIAANGSHVDDKHHGAS